MNKKIANSLLVLALIFATFPITQNVHAQSLYFGEIQVTHRVGDYTHEAAGKCIKTESRYSQPVFSDALFQKKLFTYVQVLYWCYNKTTKTVQYFDSYSLVENTRAGYRVDKIGNDTQKGFYSGSKSYYSSTLSAHFHVSQKKGEVSVGDYYPWVKIIAYWYGETGNSSGMP